MYYASMIEKKPLTVTEMASLGGHARAAKLSKEQLSKIGKKAVRAREAKRKARKGETKHKQ
jgi:hypothetical protein